MHSIGTCYQVPPAEPEPLIGGQEDVAGLWDVWLQGTPELPVPAEGGLAEIRPRRRQLCDEAGNQDTQEGEAHPGDPGQCNVKGVPASFSVTLTYFLTTWAGRGLISERAR